MRVRSIALLLLLACPATEDDDGDPVAGTSSGTGMGSESGALACTMCAAEASCHSMVDTSGHCVCEAGYAWCSDEPTDFTCCEDPAGSSSG